MEIVILSGYYLKFYSSPILPIRQPFTRENWRCTSPAGAGARSSSILRDHTYRSNLSYTRPDRAKRDTRAWLDKDAELGRNLILLNDLL